MTSIHDKVIKIPMTIPAMAKPRPERALFFVCDNAIPPKITPRIAVSPQKTPPRLHTSDAIANPDVSCGVGRLPYG